MADASRKGRLKSKYKIIPPRGKQWCWMCKTFKDTKNFPPCMKTERKKRKPCTRCETQYHREYKQKIKTLVL